jgi:hypothetical protein
MRGGGGINSGRLNEFSRFLGIAHDWKRVDRLEVKNGENYGNMTSLMPVLLFEAAWPPE